LKARDVVVGLQIDGPGRAYPWDALVKESPVEDRVSGTPLLIAVGADGKSFRVFVSRVDGKDTEFFLKGQTEDDASAAKAATSGETRPAAPAIEAATPTESKTDASGTTKVSARPAPSKPWILLDTTTASEWNFQGCAISGPALGKCLDRVPALKDYWFDWRNYHPQTSVYKR
jgi:ribosomal protein L12E/L44/L45/RPP1/RPP2